MRCTKTISPPGMASYRKSLLTPHRSMMEMCCSCFMDTKYKCLRCTHKMAFNSKSTPTSPNLQRTTYHFVQKRKILKRSAGESKTIKGAIHVFTQEGNQCGLSLVTFSYLDILKVSLNRFSLSVDHTLVNQPTLRWKRRQDRLKTAAPLLFANKSAVKHATRSSSCCL